MSGQLPKDSLADCGFQSKKRNLESSFIKFADDTTVVGLFTDNDETAYREEVRDLEPGQQPLPQRNQDKGEDCGLKEKEDRASPHSHRLGCSEAGCELQVPWCPHH